MIIDDENEDFFLSNWQKVRNKLNEKSSIYKLYDQEEQLAFLLEDPPLEIDVNQDSPQFTALIDYVRNGGQESLSTLSKYCIDISPVLCIPPLKTALWCVVIEDDEYILNGICYRPIYD